MRELLKVYACDKASNYCLAQSYSGN